MLLKSNPFNGQRLWYLATVYTSHPGGMEVGYKEACEQAHLLLSNGIPVFCPISHGHGIQNAGTTLPHTYDVWLNLDDYFLDMCEGVIVCQMPGIEKSKGVAYEVGFARALGKPVIYMTPSVIPVLPTND